MTNLIRFSDVDTYLLYHSCFSEEFCCLLSWNLIDKVVVDLTCFIRLSWYHRSGSTFASPYDMKEGYVRLLLSHCLVFHDDTNLLNDKHMSKLALLPAKTRTLALIHTEISFSSQKIRLKKFTEDFISRFLDSAWGFFSPIGKPMFPLAKFLSKPLMMNKFYNLTTVDIATR